VTGIPLGFPLRHAIPVPRPRAVETPAVDPRRHFSAETLARFEAQAARYPQRRAALIPMLHFAQEEKGWLSPETIEAVAAVLELEPIIVHEVATFYPMFHRAPVGRHVAWVCRNISCDLRGAREVVDTIRRRCGIAPGETTADGRLTLKLAECLGGCSWAPVMEVDGVYHESLDPAKVESILDGLR
jgi:NADH-quinone oxidoreductase subunit E